ncbi:MAG TPA: acetyltransferase [Candidatus Sulfopaludibacter sp.]|nr:acetyltransferase [Candidatus Sulfopaludibacter sp.]
MSVNNRSVILIGGFIEIIELLLNNCYNIAGIVDKSIDNISVHYRNSFQYLGDDEKVISLINNNKIGNIQILLSPDLPEVREKLYNFYEIKNIKHINLISLKANISSSSKIQEESSIIIQDFVNVSSNVIISRGVHINTYGNIMHDCILEDFVTIAPNAVLLGGVKVGKNSYVGSNATILPGIKIGKNSIVGAGAVVTHDVEEGSIVVGVPATKIKSKN